MLLVRSISSYSLSLSLWHRLNIRYYMEKSIITRIYLFPKFAIFSTFYISRKLQIREGKAEIICRKRSFIPFIQCLFFVRKRKKRTNSWFQINTFDEMIT